MLPSTLLVQKLHNQSVPTQVCWDLFSGVFYLMGAFTTFLTCAAGCRKKKRKIKVSLTCH
uniref:Uncharacterized protein n=1 Tax=Oreochromis aureus TaxID=47969 RepID=A0AAZ1XRR3_OREAU